MKIPMMTSKQEMDLVISHVHPDDTVVELGCWLGGTTETFLKKLDGGRLYTYDKFEWHPYMERAYRRCKGVGSTYGFKESFRGEFDFNIGNHKNHKVFEKDFETLKGTFSDEINVLFLDGIKTAEMLNPILNHFFSRVVPGGYIIDQDFTWSPLHHMFVVWAFWKLREFMKPVSREQNTVIFRVTGDWRPVNFNTRGSSNPSPYEILQALNYFMEWLC